METENQRYKNRYKETEKGSLEKEQRYVMCAINEKTSWLIFVQLLSISESGGIHWKWDK